MGSPQMLSKNQLMRTIGVSPKQYKKVIWHTNEVIVKPFLSASEYVDMIQGILHDCQASDGVVVLELVDFAMRINVISAYAFIELPDTLDDLYYIAYSDLYDTVCKAANNAQIGSIRYTIGLYINSLEVPE